MALVKCPECKKKISQMAEACPQCGFPIKGYEFDEEKKSKKHDIAKIKKIGIIVAICIVLALGVSVLVAYIQEYTYWQEIEEEREAEKKARGRLFQLSSINPIDLYGLSNENNVLGENIYDTISGYEENKDYTITSNEYYVSYTFKAKDEYWGYNDVELVLYTASNSSIINRVEYKFRTQESDFEGYLWHTKKKKITDYYNVDPIYTCVDENLEIVEIDVDTFNSLISANYKSLYHVDWKNENGVASLYIANTNDEAKDYCSISLYEN